MDEAEFQRLLAQFPVVRRRNYCRVQWKDTVCVLYLNFCAFYRIVFYSRNPSVQ